MVDLYVDLQERGSLDCFMPTNLTYCAGKKSYQASEPVDNTMRNKAESNLNQHQSEP